MSGLPALPNGTVVTVGTFDGVHLGHQAVIAEVVRRSQAQRRASMLVTFEPHPLAVVRPELAPRRLTVDGERSAALAETSLDYLMVLRFDRGLADLPPERFVEEILLGRCQMRELVVGHDHGFGRDRSGNLELLRALGDRHQFSVDPVRQVTDAGGRVVSSSVIRSAVESGDFEAAASGLGRPYRVAGVVERGDQRGRTIGVPTANVIPPPGKLLPPDGVYAVRVEWSGGRATGMLNQGTRPTIGDGRRLLEAHLFDFEGDLYGRMIQVEWVRWLRDTRRFGSLSELRAQLATDAQAARAVFGAWVPPNVV